MGQIQIKDGTAQGLAKVRHYEALHEPSKRVFTDPYASKMYTGSFIQSWLGESGTRWLYESLAGAKGLLEMLIVRTRWLDEEILERNPEQLVILGAGYDTRGFRLINDDCLVLEVDQPEVQEKKIQKLTKISKYDEVVSTRMNTSVKFIPVDFTTDFLDEKVRAVEEFSAKASTVITLEGVTQYIPKESTADTLTKVKAIVAPGSTLLITYIDQNGFDNPSSCGPTDSVQKMIQLPKTTGEPWISGWNRSEFQTFLDTLGYQVMSDTTAKDYNEKYLAPVGRRMDDLPSLERFVVATVKEP